MHDEYERAVTGRSRTRLSAGAILGLAVAGFLFTGMAASVAAFFFVRAKVTSLVEGLDRDPARVAAEMLARLDPALEVADGGADGAPVALRDLRSGEVATFGFQDLVEGSLRIRDRDGGDISIDLRGDASGGSLVIDADGERVRFDLEKADEGGTLRIRGPDGEVRLGSGGEALDPPGWLPRLGERPARPRQVYSARSVDGIMGAVTWQTALGPTRVVEQYRRSLEREGFEIVRQTATEKGQERQASLWARDADGGRHAFVVAAREGRATGVVLGYGERR